MTKLSISDECIGCGQCEGISSELFEVINGKAKPKKKTLSEEEKKTALLATENCPANAIKVSD